MDLSLPPELDRLMNEKLATGRYDTAENVLAAALHALNTEEQTIAAISEGYEDLAA